MTNRRTFLRLGGLGLAGGLLSACGGGGDGGGDHGGSAPVIPQPNPQASSWQMPDEGSQQRAVWMAFAAKEAIWGAKLSQPAQQALARIANAISAHHPVKMLVNPEDLATARQLCGASVQLFEHAIDDLWMRDTGCVFVRNGRGERAALSFNFNGWGNKQAHARDATVAARMAELSNVPLLRSRLVMEGGGIEVDGQGTAIITESCMLNDNRNPGVGKADAEQELKRLLGLEKILWLPGIANHDITDGHTDFYARFLKPGVVVAALDNDRTSFDYTVTRRHIELLRTASDARGQPLQIITLETPSQVRPAYSGKNFAAGYVNFLLTDKALFLPEFGDPVADTAARNALAAQLPGHQIVQLNIDAIAAGGGGIHCTTQQEPV
ncbi:agmatine deiminase family protein [Pseudoduganella violaceinigra]|uniref:agmatine deiminase family protein n=1 Tax=Pseudoduganella violaceinigra TaxID=246602 RepID=UPI00048A1898|nr:agmatine deiminase family protein [Pseudoduganella violaceinigra]